MGSRRKLLIDVDTGVDDAQAIMMALSHEGVDVMAITCVGGNISLDQVTTNTLRVLQVCDRLDVPVYKGATKPLVGEFTHSTSHHGDDGLGGIPEPHPPSHDLVKPESASNAMIEIVNKYLGEVTLVCLAPLTNVASALKIDPDFGSKLKNVVILGGNLSAEGEAPRLEFNFRMDPEAARVTLNVLTCPIQLLTWEACGEASLEWEWFDKLLEVKTKKGIFHKNINKQITKSRKEIRKNPAYTSCDPTAMAIALDPEGMVLEEEPVYCTVEVEKDSLRGRLIIDNDKLGRKAHHVQLVRKVDCQKLRQIYERFLM